MPEDAIRDIETISRNCFRSFAGFPGAEIVDDGKIYGVLSHVPIPFFSGIAATRLDESDLDREVESVIDRFRAKGCPFRWWITPSTQPQGLAPVLAAHGMRHAYDAPGMSADLTSVPLDVPLPPEVTVRTLASAAELGPWLDVFIQSFSLPLEHRELWRLAHERCGFGEGVPWTHFVAFLDDKPVGTSSVLVDGDLAGIYFVATIEEARGRGIGAAVTRAAMRHAHTRGATRAALQSSDLGYNVYRSLGFVHHCDLSVYDWRPSFSCSAT